MLIPEIVSSFLQFSAQFVFRHYSHDNAISDSISPELT